MKIKEIIIRVLRFDLDKVELLSKRELLRILVSIEPGVSVLAEPSSERTCFLDWLIRKITELAARLTSSTG